MKKFVEERERLLHQSLSEISAESNGIARAHRSAAVVRSVIQDIQDHITQNPFDTRETEILYFKQLAPPIYAQLFFFLRQFRVELELQHGSPESLQALLSRERGSTERFFQDHVDFCRYYSAGDSYIDDRIFIRDNAENGMLDEVEVIMGPNFCVGCYWAALLIANRLFVEYLTNQFVREPVAKLKWMKGPTNLIEVLYGQWLCGAFGSSSFKEVVEWHEAHYQINLKQHNVTVVEIFNRKIALTKFIDEIRKEMEKKAAARD